MFNKSTLSGAPRTLHCIQVLDSFVIVVIVDRITDCPPVVQYSIEFDPFRPAYHFIDVKDWNTSQLGTTGSLRLRKRL